MRRGLVALFVMAAPVAAQAFVCTQVPGSDHTVWWEQRTIHILQHVRCSDDVSDTDACKGAVTRSMEAWTDVACTDFTFVDDGDTLDVRVGYDWRHAEQNHNVVVFREGHDDDPWDTWTHQAGALAITTVTFNSRTGKILDADIEVNGVPRSRSEYHFAVCSDDGSDCTDLNDIQNTMTHEFGHVVGLDHPPEADATMFGMALEAETFKRSLAQDDMDGICQMYPPDQPATPCTPANLPNTPEPQFKQLRACDDTSLDPCGRRFPFINCAQTGGSPWLWLLVLALLRRR